jgi:hypothetical protein
LSQSAVSQSLKTLASYGAIKSSEAKQKRGKLHHAVPDSLQIAATVFRRREAIMIGEFKRQCESMITMIESQGRASGQFALMRLRSIVTTCQLAESVMQLVIAVTERDMQKHYPGLIAKVRTLTNLFNQGSQALERWTETFENAGIEGIGQWSDRLSEHLSGKLKDKISSRFGNWVSTINREHHS